MKDAPSTPSHPLVPDSQPSAVRAVFISHISEEAEVALQIKGALDADFGGKLRFFVSSERGTILPGDKWLENIHKALDEASLCIVLCSERSIVRPWIYFESGAAWFAQKTVIPMCHDGLTPSRLQPPLFARQAVILNNADDLRVLYASVASILESSVPALGIQAQELVKEELPAHGRRWRHADLTVTTKAPDAVGSPTAFALGHKQHVIYRCSHGHLQELWWDGSWHHEALTAASGAPIAVDDPSGYVLGSVQHVVYRAAGGDIYELWWDRAWQHANLTAQTGAPAAAGNPRGYSHQRSQHVVYRGEDKHLHELWWTGSWRHTDLTTAGIGSNAPLPDGNPTGYALGNKQHVIFRGVDGHVHERWWARNLGFGLWRHNDLTAASDAPSPRGDPSGYVQDGIQHVIYHGEDGHLHELWWDGVWRHTDLTVASQAPSPAGNPTGYVRGRTQRIVYRGTDAHIHELWWDGVWNHADLTQESRMPSGSPPNAVGDPAGYALGNSQRVVYRSEHGHIHQLSWE